MKDFSLWLMSFMTSILMFSKTVNVFSKFAIFFFVYLIIILNKDRSSIMCGEVKGIWFSLVFSDAILTISLSFFNQNRL